MSLTNRANMNKTTKNRSSRITRLQATALELNAEWLEGISTYQECRNYEILESNSGECELLNSQQNGLIDNISILHKKIGLFLHQKTMTHEQALKLNEEIHQSSVELTSTLATLIKLQNDNAELIKLMNERNWIINNEDSHWNNMQIAKYMRIRDNLKRVLLSIEKQKRKQKNMMPVKEGEEEKHGIKQDNETEED